MEEDSVTKVEIDGVEITVTTDKQITCVEAVTNGIRVLFEQKKPQSVSINIDGKVLAQSIVNFEEVKQKNTLKGAYVDKCLKCDCTDAKNTQFIPEDSQGIKKDSGMKMENPY